MIKALFLIFEPAKTWDGVARAQRDWKLVLLTYLLPMMLLVAVLEWIGLVHWGKSQPSLGLVKNYTASEATVYEAAQFLTVFVTIIISAYIIKALGETFHAKHTYTQAFTVVVYGLSPVFLFRLLDVFPAVNSFIVWCLGIFFSVVILYHGVPLIMRPDPPHAFGLYLMSSLLLIMVTGLERFMVMWCLSGHWKPVENYISNLATQLPF